MKSLFLSLSALCIGVCASAQSFTVYQGEKSTGFNAAKVDSVTFSTSTVDDNNGSSTMSGPRKINAKWCALGTSITWYNDHPNRFTKGYETRLLEQLKFSSWVNKGVNGGTLSSAINAVEQADYYTIEHGINDWGHSTPVGTMDDYINNTNNGTFAATYRRLIEAIFAANADAKVVLCTPRKGYGFSGYLPDHWYDAKNGIYLKQYADIIKEIAAYEGFPVADFFNECGGQHNLARLSIDVALHPNDAGYQMMANVLQKAMEKVIVEYADE